jgi:hypothetical protein
VATAAEVVDFAISDSERLRRILKKDQSNQVRSLEQRGLAKATASAWFASYRAQISQAAAEGSLDTIDACYQIILENSDRSGARTKYIKLLSDLKHNLIKLRTQLISAPIGITTSDQYPDFSPLVSDVEMQRVLISRWDECLLCLDAKAALAATVMMGGLLEALLLARVNRQADKTALFTAKATPKNAKTSSPKPLGEWMLNDFIQVLSELRWITVSATAVGAVLRDYRNFIHPQKQLTHNLHLQPADAELFWEVTKNIVRQVISSVESDA